MELVVERGVEVTETVSGEVVHVSPEVDPVNGQVCVWAEVENSAMLLKPGMRGTMVIGPKADGTEAKSEELSSSGKAPAE